MMDSRCNAFHTRAVKARRRRQQRVPERKNAHIRKAANEKSKNNRQYISNYVYIFLL